MFFDPRTLYRALAAICIGLACLNSAQAQIASESMDDISAWGERYLSSDEPDFPSNLWSNSDPDMLLSLLLSLDTGTLSPTERRLVRRIILSPAQPITGPDADLLLTERARLMLELGEARAAAALAPRLEQAALGLEAEALAVDLDLARGQNASACDRLSRPVSDRLYWQQLRAVCAALKNNFSGAALAIEVASANGLEDDWFVEAVFATAGTTPSPPPARFESGLSIALSLKAGLDPQGLDTGNIRADLAAALAQRPDLDPSLRLHFADTAYQASLLPAEELRALIDSRVAQSDFEAETSRDVLFERLLDPLTSDMQRARLLSDYLIASGDAGLTPFVKAAGLVTADLAALPRNDQTRPYVPVFARAALALGETATARAWLDLAYSGSDSSDSSSDSSEPTMNKDAEKVIVAGAPEPDNTGLLSETSVGPQQLVDETIDKTPSTTGAPLEAPVIIAPRPENNGEDEMASANPAPLTPTDMMLTAALEADAARQVAPIAAVIETPNVMGDLGRLDEIFAPPPEPEPFLVALIETLTLLNTHDIKPSDHPDLTGRLITTAVTEADFEQASILLNLLPAFGFRLDAEARDFLITQPVLGIPVDEHIAVAIDAAANDLAFAEATLMILTQTRGNVSTLSPRDLGQFVRALRVMQAHDIAAGFAREASGFWIVPEGAVPDLPPETEPGPTESLIGEPLTAEPAEPVMPSDP